MYKIHLGVVDEVIIEYGLPFNLFHLEEFETYASFFFMLDSCRDKQIKWKLFTGG